MVIALSPLCIEQAHAARLKSLKLLCSIFRKKISPSADKTHICGTEKSLTCLKQDCGAASDFVSARYFSQLKRPAQRTSSVKWCLHIRMVFFFLFRIFLLNSLNAQTHHDCPVETRILSCPPIYSSSPVVCSPSFAAIQLQGPAKMTKAAQLVTTTTWHTKMTHCDSWQTSELLMRHKTVWTFFPDEAGNSSNMSGAWARHRCFQVLVPDYSGKFAPHSPKKLSDFSVI